MQYPRQVQQSSSLAVYFDVIVLGKKEIIMQFTSRSEALKYAKEHSIKNPGIGYFVNWVEDNVWDVSIYSEFMDQEFYISGNLICPEWED